MDVNLPETAKALSAPVTKLIEVCAAGCGKLYEPTGIRRRARADGDALVIMEEARGRSALARRAAQRVLDVEERRQINIEAIAAQAEELLPEKVSDSPVDDDWAARFFSECKDIGNEQMQTVWAKILAGEVATPGSFSVRTLWVLKNLSTGEAQKFNLLCKSSFRSEPGSYFPLVGVGSRKYFDDLGLDFPGLQKLRESGLVSEHSTGLIRANTRWALFRAPHVALLVESDVPARLPLGQISLTTAGAELAAICEWDIPEERIEAVEAAVKAPFRVTRGRAAPASATEFEWEPL